MNTEISTKSKKLSVQELKEDFKNIETLETLSLEEMELVVGGFVQGQGISGNVPGVTSVDIGRGV